MCGQRGRQQRTLKGLVLLANNTIIRETRLEQAIDKRYGAYDPGPVGTQYLPARVVLVGC